MYEWQENMDEISGFGRSYEAACRAMLKSGLDWWDTFPDSDPKYQGYKNVFGVCIDNNNDARDLDIAIQMGAHSIDPNSGMTGAMHQAVVSHIMYIHQNGWEEYVKLMSKKG